eukprot:403356766
MVCDFVLNKYYFDEEILAHSTLACQEFQDLAVQPLLSYGFDQKFLEQNQSAMINHREGVEIRCKCANPSVCKYDEPDDYNITLMLWIQETRFGYPDYFHKQSYYYFAYKPMISQFHTRLELSMRATIKNYTENIWGVNKHFIQDNITFVHGHQNNLINPQNVSNPVFWKDPFYQIQLYNNLGDDEIEVYTIVPKTILDGLVQIGALVGLYGLLFQLLIIINRHFTNKRKLRQMASMTLQIN